MVKPLLDAGAPSWMHRFALNLPNVFKSLTPKSPERLASFTFAELPNPAAWLGCIAYVSDLQKVGMSNGVDWLTTDGGSLI